MMSNQEIYVESANEKENAITGTKCMGIKKNLDIHCQRVSGKVGAAYTPTLHMRVSA